MGFDEREDFRPGVRRGCCEVLLLAVEEAVRRPVVGGDLVLNTRGGERLVERRIVFGGDVLICSRLEREDRHFALRWAVYPARRAVHLSSTCCSIPITREQTSTS